MAAKEKVVDLLRKLFNHEKSARAIGNLAEAEAFAARAQELLFKHKLEMSDIEFAEEEKNEPVANEVLDADQLTGVPQSSRKQSWISILLNGIAQPNFVRVVGSSRANSYHLIGRESDREVVRQLFKYLYDACMEVVETEAEKYAHSPEIIRDIEYRGYSSAGIAVKTFKSGFKLGFASAIYRRLEREKKQLVAGAQQQGLIRLDQMEKALDDHTKQLFPSLRSTGSARTKSRAGYDAGHAYGSAVGINGNKRLTA